MSNYLKYLTVAAVAMIVAGCSGDDDDDSPQQSRFQIEIVNATNNQPLSPAAVIVHGDDYSGWSIGSAASDGLASLAESGSATEFLAEAQTLSYAEDTFDGLIFPGETQSIEITSDDKSALYLTLASMLVNTNDAFSGTTMLKIGQLTTGETLEILAPVYDAGTENNDELAANIPGPAAGGAGNSDGRESHNFVTRHPGVVTRSDGYTESALDESHRFDNGAMVIRVTRTL